MGFNLSLEGSPEVAWNVSTMFYCLVEFSETVLVDSSLDQEDFELVNWSYIQQLLPSDIWREVLGLPGLGVCQASWGI